MRVGAQYLTAGCVCDGIGEGMYVRGGEICLCAFVRYKGLMPVIAALNWVNGELSE